jgi:TIP41-like family
VDNSDSKGAHPQCIRDRQVRACSSFWSGALTRTAAHRASSGLPVPLPEIPFGNNELRLEHAPSQFTIRFDTLEALHQVDGTGQEAGTVQVAYADDWKKSRLGLGMEKLQGKQWDWTYSTTYAGSQASRGGLRYVVKLNLTSDMSSQVPPTRQGSSSRQMASRASHWRNWLLPPTRSFSTTTSPYSKTSCTTTE